MFRLLEDWHLWCVVTVNVELTYFLISVNKLHFLIQFLYPSVSLNLRIIIITAISDYLISSGFILDLFCSICVSRWSVNLEIINYSRVQLLSLRSSGPTVKRQSGDN